MNLALVQQGFYTFILSLVILLVGLAIGILVKKILQRILHEFDINKALAKKRIMFNFESGISSLIAYGIYLFSIIVFLERLGIRSIVFYIIAGIVGSIILLTFAVRLKDVIPNSLGWIRLKQKKIVVEGQKIRLQNISGTVIRIRFMETEVETARGDTLHIPNLLFREQKTY